MSDIWKIPDGIAISAVVNKDTWLLCGVGFVALPIIVFSFLSGVSFTNISAPEGYFIFPFILIVIAGFLVFFYRGICFLLHCTARIEITADMVSLKVGTITLRKLPTDQILTVGFMEQVFGRGKAVYTPQLVLTTESAEDVFRNGEKRIAKSRAIRQELAERNISTSSKKAAVYARFGRYSPTLWQGRNKYILLEFSQARILVLREYLFSAKFLDDTFAADNI